MSLRPRGNSQLKAELRELVARSGLSSYQFAILLGLPYNTMHNYLRASINPTGAVVNGARFIMLRLGHAVEIKPITDPFFAPRRRSPTKRAKPR